MQCEPCSPAPAAVTSLPQWTLTWKFEQKAPLESFSSCFFQNNLSQKKNQNKKFQKAKQHRNNSKKLSYFHAYFSLVRSYSGVTSIIASMVLLLFIKQCYRRRIICQFPWCVVHYQNLSWVCEMMMWILKLYFYVCACVYTGIHRDLKKVLGPWELEV